MKEKGGYRETAALKKLLAPDDLRLPSIQTANGGICYLAAVSCVAIRVIGVAMALAALLIC